MRKIYLFVLTILVFNIIVCVPTAQAQTLTTEHGLVYEGDKHLQRAPGKAGFTLHVGKTDKVIQEWAQSHRTTTSDKAASAVESLGDYHIMLPMLAVVYYYGSEHDNVKLERTGREGLRAVVATGAISSVFKKMVHRVRPNGRNEQSFPSHHAASAFAIAAVTAREYGEGTAAYGVASMTALSRINDNEHWASDVLFGAALGYYVGKAAASH